MYLIGIIALEQKGKTMRKCDICGEEATGALIAISYMSKMEPGSIDLCAKCNADMVEAIDQIIEKRNHEKYGSRAGGMKNGIN